MIRTSNVGKTTSTLYYQGTKQRSLEKDIPRMLKIFSSEIDLDQKDIIA